MLARQNCNVTKRSLNQLLNQQPPTLQQPLTNNFISAKPVQTGIPAMKVVGG